MNAHKDILRSQIKRQLAALNLAERAEKSALEYGGAAADGPAEGGLAKALVEARQRAGPGEGK